MNKAFVQGLFHTQGKNELLTTSGHQGILRYRRVTCLAVSLTRGPYLLELMTPSKDLSTH